MEEVNGLALLAGQASDIVRAVAGQIAAAYGTVGEQEIETKSRNSLVSRVDKEAERALVTGLRSWLPEAGFLTEENTVHQLQARDRWIIDPLDGTTNFLHGLPFFAISVAFERDGELVLGIVHEVLRNEHFVAWKGGGAWLNGARIHVSGHTALADCLIATGFPYYDYQRMDAYIEVLKQFMLKTRGVRRLGSAALDLAYVACGRFDAYYEYALQPWDVAGGIVLVREAGVSSPISKGNANGADRGVEILAAGQAIHPLAQSEINTYF